MQAYSIADIIGFLNAKYGGVPLFVQPYQYSVLLGNDIAAGSSVAKTLQITANQDFVLTNLFLIDAEDSQIGGKLLIIDTGTGDPFTYGPVPAATFAAMPNNASGGMFGQLPYPRYLSGRTSLSIQYTAAAASPLTDALTLVLNGFNVRAAQ